MFADGRTRITLLADPFVQEVLHLNDADVF